MNVLIKITLILLVFLTVLLNGQNVPSAYYKLTNDDTLYYISTDIGLITLSSNNRSGSFSFQNIIVGNFTQSTNYALNDSNLIIENNDTLYLYNILNPKNPQLITTQFWTFQINNVYEFGPYYILKSGDIYKLIKYKNNQFEIVEDTLYNQDIKLFYYPYFITGFRNIHKYVEGFGTSLIFIIDDPGIHMADIHDGVYVFHCLQDPPNIVCDLRGRVLEEPDFAHSFISFFCPTLHYAVLYGNDLRFTDRYWNFRAYPDYNTVFTSGRQFLYEHGGIFDYSLAVTDNYLFLLGSDIFYSNSLSEPAEFYEIDFTITSINDQINLPPDDFELKQNYPNPFNPSTKIKFSITPVPKRDAFVRLKVYGVLGNEVATLVNEDKPAGDYEITFDADKYNLPSGIYFYRLTSGSFSQSRKMLLIK
jgi:hypothetical protein